MLKGLEIGETSIFKKKKLVTEALRKTNLDLTT